MNDSSAVATRRSGKRAWLILIPVLVVAAIGGGVWWRLHSTASSSTSPFPGGPGGGNGNSSTVVAQPVTTGPMAQTVSALGTVTPTDTATVHAQVSGRLTAIYFKEGDEVKAGQKLAQIDPRSFQASLDSARAQLAHDRALLAAAQVDLKRYRTLLAQDSIASQQVDTQAALVQQYIATVAQDQAAVSQAELQLSYAAITAPITGRVGLKQVDVGNLVQSSDTNGIVIITAVHPINVVFPITQQQLPDLLSEFRAGHTLTVEAWDSSNTRQMASGRVTSVDNQIDITTGTVKVKATFDNRDDSLFPNQFVNVRLELAPVPDAILAPAAAVQPGTDSPYVFVVQSANDTKTVSLRKIKTGPGNDQSVSVLKGLEPGEEVVVDGVDRLHDGAKVNVVASRETLKEPARPRHRRWNGNGNGPGTGDGKAPADVAPGSKGPDAGAGAHPPAAPGNGAGESAWMRPHPQAGGDAPSSAKATDAAPGADRGNKDSWSGHRQHSPRKDDAAGDRSSSTAPASGSPAGN